MPDIELNITNARRVYGDGGKPGNLEELNKFPSFIEQISKTPEPKESGDLEEAIRLIKRHIEKNRNA